MSVGTLQFRLQPAQPFLRDVQVISHQQELNSRIDDFSREVVIAQIELLQALVAGVEIAMELASQPAFKNIIKRWIAPKNIIGKKAIEGFIRDALTSYFHPVGTCKMGVRPEAVVDSQLKAHGITGLRVAGASIMPTITSANTNAATMMIGEVASQTIIARL